MISIAAFPKCWLEDISDRRMDLFDWIERSVELACDGLELYSRFLVSHEAAYLAKVRRRVESLGMSVPMMCYSADFTQADPSARRQEIEQQIEMIRVTAELGGRFCRTLSGQARPGLSVEQGVAWVVECLERCLPAAEEFGVDLVIENHFKDGYWQYREFAQRRDVFLAVVERVDSPCFGVQFDPSNAVVAGDDPIELLEAVLPRVKTVHASDRYVLPGASLDDMSQADGTLGYPEALVHGVTGRGSNDYDAIFSRLAAVHFDGWISIEDGMNGMAEMKASVDFLKTMRARYFAEVNG
jgi:sugar phosphate isomerase/epimerase